MVALLLLGGVVSKGAPAKPMALQANLSPPRRLLRGSFPHQKRYVEEPDMSSVTLAQ